MKCKWGISVVKKWFVITRIILWAYRHLRTYRILLNTFWTPLSSSGHSPEIIASVFQHFLLSLSVLLLCICSKYVDLQIHGSFGIRETQDNKGDPYNRDGGHIRCISSLFSSMILFIGWFLSGMNEVNSRSRTSVFRGNCSGRNSNLGFYCVWA